MPKLNLPDSAESRPDLIAVDRPVFFQTTRHGSKLPSPILVHSASGKAVLHHFEVPLTWLKRRIYSTASQG